MSDDAKRGQGGPSAEQLRYARVLDRGMKVGLVVLTATFAVYVAGLMPVQVSFEMLPRLWSLPVTDYLRESGMPAGWGWLGLLAKGDVLALTGIALLAGVSLPCLLRLAPAYAAAKDRTYLGITLALVAVLLLAASGVLGSSH